MKQGEYVYMWVYRRCFEKHKIDFHWIHGFFLVFLQRAKLIDCIFGFWIKVIYPVIFLWFWNLFQQQLYWNISNTSNFPLNFVIFRRSNNFPTKWKLTTPLFFPFHLIIFKTFQKRSKSQEIITLYLLISSKFK